MQIIKDPRLLSQSLGPWIVLSNNINDPIAQGIDLVTNIKGIDPEDHAMLSINQGEFVWESMSLWNAYKQASMNAFLVKGGQLKFVQLVNNNPDFTAAFTKSVQQRLARPGLENSYDFLGVTGQLIGKVIPGAQNFIHTPGLEYCSVDVIRHLVNACPYLPKEDQIVINNIPAETNPETLWQIILNNPKTFFFYGQWDYTTGVLA
jgi:hypothetical protein